MTDRELLELAAKAAGIDLHHWTSAGRFVRVSEWVDDDGGFWDPLEDDGDALRLAVKLGLELGRGIGGSVYAFRRHDCAGISEELGGDPCAATRRAIVRAAAEIAQSGDGSPGSESTRPDQPKLPESGAIGISSIGLGAEGEQ